MVNFAKDISFGVAVPSPGSSITFSVKASFTFVEIGEAVEDTGSKVRVVDADALLFVCWVC